MTTDLPKITFTMDEQGNVTGANLGADPRNESPLTGAKSGFRTASFPS